MSDVEFARSAPSPAAATVSARQLEWTPAWARRASVAARHLEWRPPFRGGTTDGWEEDDEPEIEPTNDRAEHLVLAEIIGDVRVQTMAARLRRTIDNLRIPAPWTAGVNPNALDIDIVPATFNFKKFHRGLVSGMANFFPGEAYAFVLTKKGQMFSGAASGDARGPVASDAPQLPMTIDQPVNLASVSKIITCGAVLKALESMPFTDLDDAIWPFFPRHWAVHPSFAGITFRNCLQFRIGQISQTNGGQGTLIAHFRSWYETGSRSGTALNAAQFGLPAPFETYNNVCHGWFRLALFFMTAPGQLVKDVEDLAEVFVPPNFPASARDTLVDWFASLWYIDWVRNALLKPIGVQWADMNPVSSYDPRPLQEKLDARTLYYPSPPAVPPVAGAVPGDWTLAGGGGGWIMSVRDLARYAAHLHFGGLVSAESRDLIFNYDDPAAAFSLGQIVDQFGIHFRRGGAVSGGGAGYRSRFYDFSGGLAQLCFVSNHDMNGGVLDASVILPAFAGAWS